LHEGEDKCPQGFGEEV